MVYQKKKKILNKLDLSKNGKCGIDYFFHGYKF